VAERPTAAEVEQRTDEILELVLTRAPYRAICRYASSKWGLTPRQTQRYLAKAKDRVVEMAKPNQLEEFAKARGSYDLIFAKQMASKDYRGARATLDKLVELLGLERYQIESEAKDLSALSDAELAREFLDAFPGIFVQFPGLLEDARRMIEAASVEGEAPRD
jgi:hypothetical protein